jgi:hypothetical protein
MLDTSSVFFRNGTQMRVNLTDVKIKTYFTESIKLLVQSIIYLSRVLCLSVCDCVCVSQFVSERSAILLVLIIKLTKATRRRVWRGRDRDGEIGKRQIVEGGCEETFHC